MNINNFFLNKKKNFTHNYFNKFKRSHYISELKYLYNKFNHNFNLFDKKKFSICGRIFSKRIMGKSIFIDIKDLTGKIQLYITKKNFLNTYDNIIESLNFGDIIGVKGFLFLTKTEELSIKINYLKILSKNFYLFPDKKFGLIDKEICYRQRYLDLMVNDDSKKKFLIRSKVISKIREFFLSRNFLEVETPVLQLIPGGAEAKPFETYHNYLNSKMFLRISPELYLKKLIVGGLERVFEIGKNFRNEGVSTRHHPEFTTIEFYQAYANYIDLMTITEMLFKFIVKSIFNNYYFKYNNITINFLKPFEKIDFLESIIQFTGLEKKNLFNYEFLFSFLNNHKIKINKNHSIYELQFILFENMVENNLTKPTFILHHPVDVSPLAKRLEENINLTERFELYICGKEIANGFSELNDPEDQLLRFKNQIKNENNIKEIDFDFIESLRYGLPPTAGEGIGIDRLIMLFTNSNSIKDVILFPIMKKEQNINE